ncbi:hypothetical protein ABWJ92_07740 [Streptomyces sp. NPDC000609]|uniref:hypothetical protein n=1 Tax=Streptomyces sp. NPDC000609 TaxID=3160957 RepID=UPI0033945502
MVIAIATGLSMAADPVGGGPGQEREARQHHDACVDRPLQAGHRGVQIVTDAGQSDVDDGDVHHDDDHTGAADGKHQRPSSGTECGHGGPIRSRVTVDDRE